MRFAFARLLGLAVGVWACGAGFAAPPPNVLLVIADDLNTDLGVYGHPLMQTPNIDRLARRGVVFSRAYTQYPQCNQSRASFLTGRYPDRTAVLTLQEHFREALPDAVTLPQHFRQQGYFTARVGKVFHQGVPDGIGTDGLDDPPSWDLVVNPAGVDVRVDERIVSIVPPEHDRRSFGGTLSWLRLDGDEAHTDELGAAEAIHILQRYHPRRTGRPLFLALGFYRPHTPYVAPGRWYDRYPPEYLPLAEVPPGDRENKPVAALADRPWQAAMTDLQKREAIQGYYASISFVDEQLGKVLDELEAQGLADDTLVVFTSDHGYQLGAHGLWQKRDLFENTLRTPLILAAPGRLAPARTTDTLVEMVDIYPTLVALAGLPAPASPLEGRDLAAVLEGRAPPRTSALSQSWSVAQLTRPERRGMDVMGYSIRTDRYRYTEWSGGDEGVELYDYRADPNEYRNLAVEPGSATLLRELKTLLETRLADLRD